MIRYLLSFHETKQLTMSSLASRSGTKAHESYPTGCTHYNKLQFPWSRAYTRVYGRGLSMAQELRVWPLLATEGLAGRSIVLITVSLTVDHVQVNYTPV